MEVSVCTAEAYSVVALKRHGQPLPQEGLSVIDGDGMRPPANLYIISNFMQQCIAIVYLVYL